MCAKQHNDGNLIWNVFNKLRLHRFTAELLYRSRDIIMLKKKKEKRADTD